MNDGPQNDKLATGDLLQRWYEGDQEALDVLVSRDLSWIQRRVRDRLGPQLRTKLESQDLVQESLLEFLRYGPRFRLDNREHFRALLARIIENTIRGQLDHFTAQRRAIHREAALPSDGTLHLDPLRRSAPTASQRLEQDEWQTLVRLALELLDPDARALIVARAWRKEPFADIARDLGIRSDAARMRYVKAVTRLAKVIRHLQLGDVAEGLEAAGG